MGTNFDWIDPDVVLSDFAERYPYQVLSEEWKVSRWE